jgi:cytochrome P450
MFALIVWGIGVSLKAIFFGLLVPYILYYRVYCYFLAKWHYQKEGAKINSDSWPVLGSILPLLRMQLRSNKTGDNLHPMTHLYNEEVQTNSGCYVFFMTNEPCVSILDPKVVQAMCTTHNSQFDKHPLVLNLVRKLLGEGILFSQTDTRWRKRRTAISPAFYKGKLVKLVELAKDMVVETNERWQKLAVNGRTRINFMEEVSNMHVKILLKCALGEDVSEKLIDFESNGKVEKKTISYSLRTTFHHLLNRMSDPHVIFFPFLADKFIFPGERAIERNCQRLREYILKVVQDRRERMKHAPEDAGDLLGILLEDQNFNGDDVMIVDECITFFFAGS